ncbi:MAG: RDD family protein, partial [Pyrinomonadaceae bacterium]|nr:RDD family protein [Pyrinomonadaceae bacterium]
MQCPSCRAVYSNGLSICPRCKTPASPPSAETQTASLAETTAEKAAHSEDVNGAETVAALANSTSEAEAAAPPASTLIEFPGVSRNRPQWRKDLSERVREIQERRAREAAREAIAAAEQPATSPQLGLVPQPDAPAVNPIVVAALKRLERARQSTPQATRTTRASMGGAATATARVVEEQYQPEENQELTPGALSLSAPLVQPQAEQRPEEIPAEATRERERTLVVVPPVMPLKTTLVANKAEQPASAKILEDESQIDLNKAAPTATPFEESFDDRAPIVSRVVGSFIDLLVVAFASSPFAAIIELTNGNWSDIRVAVSMGGIILTVMFLYLAASTALAGRTWGMSLLSIRAVDADSGLPPTTKQSIGRAILYRISLASFGLGILYA